MIIEEGPWRYGTLLYRLNTILCRKKRYGKSLGYLPVMTGLKVLKLVALIVLLKVQLTQNTAHYFFSGK